MVIFWDREYAVIARERADLLFIFENSKNDPISNPPISSFSSRTCGFSIHFPRPPKNVPIPNPPISSFSARTCGFAVHFWRSLISCSKHQGTTACPTFDYQSKNSAIERDRQTDGRTDGRTDRRTNKDFRGTIQ